MCQAAGTRAAARPGGVKIFILQKRGVGLGNGLVSRSIPPHAARMRNFKEIVGRISAKIHPTPIGDGVDRGRAGKI